MFFRAEKAGNEIKDVFYSADSIIIPFLILDVHRGRIRADCTNYAESGQRFLQKTCFFALKFHGRREISGNQKMPRTSG